MSVQMGRMMTIEDWLAELVGRKADYADHVVVIPKPVGSTIIGNQVNAIGMMPGHLLREDTPDKGIACLLAVFIPRKALSLSGVAAADQADAAAAARAAKGGGAGA